MSIDLRYKHQQNTYKLMQEALETSGKAAYIYPTGCGKSFPALKYIEDNADKNATIVVPSNFIKRQFERNIIKYLENGAERLKNGNIKIITYQKAYFKKKKIAERNNQIKNSIIKRKYPLDKRFGLSRKFKIPQPDSDIVIFDEIHRMGAKSWEEAVDQMMKNNPNRKIIGMTATPERTDKRNMAYEKFGDDIVYEMSLTEALSGEKEGEVLLKTPNYIRVLSQLKADLPIYQEQINLIEDETIKEKYVGLFKKLDTIVSNSPDIQDVMLAGMKKKNGKYIVFCKDRDDLLDKMKHANEIFGKVNSKINVDYVLSKRDSEDTDGKTKSQNETTLEEFELRENGDGLNLLFCVDMLNEGVHLEGIDGEVLFDLTTSPILYKQRIGRVLSSDKDAGNTVIIDAVNNWINQIDTYRELETSIHTGTHRDNPNEDDKDKDEDKDNLMKLSPVETELLEILKEIGEIYKYNNSISLNSALEIKKWCEESFEGKKIYERRLPSASQPGEERLGSSLTRIKQNILNKYKGKELNEIENETEKKIVEIIRQLDWDYGRYGTPRARSFLSNAIELKEWCEETFRDKKEYERRLPSTGSNDEKEVHLAGSLSHMRNKILKKYNGIPLEQIENLTDREIVGIVRYLDSEYGIYSYGTRRTPYSNLVEIKEWCEENFKDKKIYERRLPTQNANDEYERKLAKALNISQTILNKYKGINIDSIENESDKKAVELLNELREKYGIYSKGENAKTSYGLALQILEWCEETFKDKKEYERRLPSADKEDERKLGIAFQRLKTKFKNKDIKDDIDQKAFEIYQIIERDYGKSRAVKGSSELARALEILEWCEEKFKDKKIYERRLPVTGIAEEHELAVNWKNMKSFINKYQGKELDEIDDEYAREAIRILRKLEDEYGIYSYGLKRTAYSNLIEIKEWCEEKFKDKKIYERRLPSEAKPGEERLAKVLNEIKNGRLKKYEHLKLEEIDNEETRKTVEVLREILENYGIYNVANKRTSLGNALQLQEWCEETFEGKKIYERRLPDEKSLDEKERSAAEAYLHLVESKRRKNNGQLTSELANENDIKAFEILEKIRQEYGRYNKGSIRTDLGKILELLDWCQEYNKGKKEFEKRLPNQGSKDKKEKGLAKAYSRIKSNSVKKYQGCPLDQIEDEDERKIAEIIRFLDSEYGKYIAGNAKRNDLGNIIEILYWCQDEYTDSGVKKIPSMDSEDEKEKELSKKLNSIRRKVIQKYGETKLEEIENPQDREITRIVRLLYSEYMSDEQKRQYDDFLQRILKKSVSTHVDSNQQTREELESERIQDSEKGTTGLNDDREPEEK